MKQWTTTEDFIANGKIPSSAQAGFIVETEGYYSKGDGGGASWRFTGVTGQTASQSPSQLGDALLTDASGNQWGLVVTRGAIDARALGCKLDAEQLLDAATDDILPLRAANKGMLTYGGGEVILSGLAAVSDTLEISQRVIFQGKSKFFANQFTNNEVRPSGCGFYVLPSHNKDVINLKLNIYDDSGTLREVINNKKLLDYRYFGGIKDLIVYGNRSNTANPPSVTDKNTTGSGVICSGVRYPVVQNIVSMMCAEQGIETASFDYGLGSNACNNLLFNRITLLSNAGNGCSLSGGDSIVADINAGYNGLNGISSVMGASRITGISWNNEQDGVNISGGDRANYDISSYDNKRQGFRITNTKGVIVKGIANANGRDTGLNITDRVGVLTGNSNELLRLDIVTDGEYLGTTYQAYGFNISNATNPVCVAGSFAGNNFTSNWLITAPANIIKDSNAP